MKFSDSSASPPVPLTTLRPGDVALVTSLESTGSLGANLDDVQLLLGRLRDLGFVAGAHCEIMARMWFGGDPVAVRIGGSTFALRRAEAAAVRVRRLQEQPGVAGLASGHARAAIA